MSTRTRVLAAVLASVVVLISATARAHGGPPSYEMIVSDPRDPMRLLAATNFGMVASTDGGRTWGWICPAAISLRADVEDPLIAITQGGVRVAGDAAGLWIASEDGCDWRLVDGFASRAVGAVVAGGGRDLWIGTSAESRANEVFRSADEGASFASVLGPTPDVWFESIAVAPSDPARIYVTQHRPPMRTEPWEATLFRSEDRGETWSAHPFALADREWRLYLLAVDPTDSNVILARTQNLYPDGRERLMRSEDGGRTFVEVLRMRQLADAAWSPDGAVVWVGGPVDGLYRSDDGGRTFAVVQPTMQVRCTLARGRREVWVCGDDWNDGFGIARSVDGGATFETVARLRSITGILACPPESRVATVCSEHEPMLRSILDTAPRPDGGLPEGDAGAEDDDAGTSLRDGGRLDGGTPRRDGGAPLRDGGAAAPAAGGCACAVAAGGLHGARPLLALAVALLAFAVRAQAGLRSSWLSRG
jgi:hypothetical protein